MKRNRKRQVTAMAMAVMMAAASFNVSGIAMPVYAAGCLCKRPGSADQRSGNHQ